MFQFRDFAGFITLEKVAYTKIRNLKNNLSYGTPHLKPTLVPIAASRFSPSRFVLLGKSDGAHSVAIRIIKFKKSRVAVNMNIGDFNIPFLEKAVVSLHVFGEKIERLMFRLYDFFRFINAKPGLKRMVVLKAESDVTAVAASKGHFERKHLQIPPLRPFQIHYRDKNRIDSFYECHFTTTP
jgi:hypothetical protein